MHLNAIVLGLSAGIALFAGGLLFMTIAKSSHWGPRFRRFWDYHVSVLAGRREVRTTETGLPFMLHLLETMTLEFMQVTDADVDRSARRLKTPGARDTTLGMIWDPNIKKVWALADKMGARRDEFAISARDKADTDAERDRMLEEAVRADAWEDCLRDLFYTAAREEIGSHAWITVSANSPRVATIGVRAGWVIVRPPDAPTAMQALFGGLTGSGE